MRRFCLFMAGSEKRFVAVSLGRKGKCWTQTLVETSVIRSHLFWATSLRGWIGGGSEGSLKESDQMTPGSVDELSGRSAQPSVSRLSGRNERAGLARNNGSSCWLPFSSVAPLPHMPQIQTRANRPVQRRSPRSRLGSGCKRFPSRFFLDAVTYLECASLLALSFGSSSLRPREYARSKLRAMKAAASCRAPNGLEIR